MRRDHRVCLRKPDGTLCPATYCRFAEKRCVWVPVPEGARYEELRLDDAARPSGANPAEFYGFEGNVGPTRPLFEVIDLNGEVRTVRAYSTAMAIALSGFRPSQVSSVLRRESWY